MRKIFLILLGFSVLLGTSFLPVFKGSVYAKGGFDEAGYNRQARIFNGTAMSWCMDKVGNETYCENAYGDWANDKLLMKWNADWDRGNEEGWSDPNGYDAWLSNEWNGKVPEGSGEVWHYKIKWVGECPNGEMGPNGGYCVWGQFETLMDQGTTADHIHTWLSHSSPTGYGNN